VAVLRPDAFKPTRPAAQSIWLLTVKKARVTWQRERETLEFDAADWS
jgi:hypothetical protein